MILMLSEVCFLFGLYQFICRLLLSINDEARIIWLGMDQILFVPTGRVIMTQTRRLLNITQTERFKFFQIMKSAHFIRFFRD